MGRKQGKKVQDHLGNSYDSILEMCRAYNISDGVYRYRIKNGCSVRQALTAPLSDYKYRLDPVDHLGNTFESVIAMCNHYGITAQVFTRRIEIGWSIERALTAPIRSHSKIIKDHKGQEFNSIESMCNHYGIHKEAFNHRITHGWTLKDALEVEVRRNTGVYDHLGHRYESIDAMCKQYEIKASTFRSRIHRGWDVERALTMNK